MGETRQSAAVFCRCCIFSLAFVFPASGRVLVSQNDGHFLPTLTTARAAHQLTIKEAARNYPVHIHAVVTYYDSSIDPRRPTLFVSDSSGGVFVTLSKIPAVDLKAGELIDITGVSGAGDFAPIVQDAQARVIAQSHLPSSAPRVSMGELLSGAEDGQWVEIEGVVRAVRHSSNNSPSVGKNVFLDIALADGKLIATTVSEPGVDYAQLVDARVLIRGNASPEYNHQGQMTGADLLFPGFTSIKVEQAAPLHPFAAPVERVSDLLRYSPGSNLHQRVHVRGTVTLHWPGRMLCIRDGENGLCAQTAQASPLKPGDSVDVIGFPMIGEFNPTLSEANYRFAGSGTVISAITVTPEQVLRNNPDAALVAIEGQLIGVNDAAEDPTIVLSAGNLTFTATLPREALAGKFPGAGKGSWLRLTGICVMQSDGSGRTTGSGFPIANAFHILLRSPADGLILHKPSWWNAAHTLRVLVLALGIALAALLRMFTLGQRVKQQTFTILESEKQFRYLATHDGLTGLPNRHAILTMLSASLESAQKHETKVCIAVIDLDYFKEVNDTYGHLAGDEVLRQAAGRLSSSIRKTDSIGRYGGEEFLIVFRDADEAVGAERGELIRKAVCSAPVTFGTHTLSVSCSIGIASTHDGSVESVTALIAQADDALYRAKANGRNRVELSSPAGVATRSGM